MHDISVTRCYLCTFSFVSRLFCVVYCCYLLTNSSYRELSSTFARLCHLVDEATNDMDADIKTLEREIKQLEEAANSAKVLRNKANYITKEMEMFDDAFLKLRN